MTPRSATGLQSLLHAGLSCCFRYRGIGQIFVAVATEAKEPRVKQRPKRPAAERGVVYAYNQAAVAA
jgi:hypothetical protein